MFSVEVSQGSSLKLRDPPAVPRLLLSPSKPIFTSATVSVCFTSGTSSWLSLRFFICVLSCSSLRALSIFVIIVCVFLYARSDAFNVPAMAASDVALSLQVVFFALWYVLVIVSLIGIKNVLGKRNCYEQASAIVEVVCQGKCLQFKN